MDAEPYRFSPVDHALLDCLQTIIEVLAAKRIATHEEFGAMFRHQREQAEERNPEAVAAFLILERFCREYGAAQRLLNDPPAGTA